MRRPRALAVAAALLVIAAVISACGSTGSSGTAPSAAASVPAPSLPAASAATSASIEPSAPPPAALVVDSALLARLPAKVGDVERTADPENAAQLIGDPTLGTTASKLALARYTKGDEIMVVSVIQLRPGIYSEGFFDGWRADYDASACQPAGGATGTEKVETIGSLQVHVGTCANGGSTYHAHLDDDVLVSAIAVGGGSLGKDVMTGVTP